MGLYPCIVWISTQPHYKLCILVSWEVTHIFSVVNHGQDFDQLFQGFDRLTVDTFLNRELIEQCNTPVSFLFYLIPMASLCWLILENFA